MNATMRTSEVLTKALALLDDGHAWCKGALERGGSHCAIGAIQAVTHNGWGRDNLGAYIALSDAVGPTSAVSTFNNAPERVWPDIKGAFCRAIEAERAKEAEPAPLSPCALACAAVVMGGNAMLGANL